MGAGRKAPVITVEILDHLGAFKRQPTRADTAGENGHRCQKRSKRRLHVRAAGARRQVAARPPISSTVYRHPEVKRRLTSSRGHQDGSPLTSHRASKLSPSALCRRHDGGEPSFILCVRGSGLGLGGCQRDDVCVLWQCADLAIRCLIDATGVDGVKHLAAMKILSHARRPGCVWPLGARAQQMALPKVEGHNSGERIQESTS